VEPTVCGEGASIVCADPCGHQNHCGAVSADPSTTIRRFAGEVVTAIPYSDANVAANRAGALHGISWNFGPPSDQEAKVYRTLPATCGVGASTV